MLRNVCTSGNVAKADCGGQSRFGHVVHQYGRNGVSVVVIGSVTQFTEGAISYLGFIQVLHSLNISICFRRRNVRDGRPNTRFCVAVCKYVTRDRSRGVDTGIH